MTYHHWLGAETVSPDMPLKHWIALQVLVDNIAAKLPPEDRDALYAMRDHANYLRRQLQAAHAATHAVDDKGA